MIGRNRNGSDRVLILLLHPKSPNLRVYRFFLRFISIFLLRLLLSGRDRTACVWLIPPPMNTFSCALAAALICCAGLCAEDKAVGKPTATQPVGVDAVDLTDPSKFKETAPATFKAKFETTKGDVVIEVVRAQAPLGADRFYNLVKAGYFKDIAFFRVIPGFMAQFGIHGNPKVASSWRAAKIQDDPVKSGNPTGAISFAMAGPNTRTTQFFINLADNSRLDGMGFASFGKVVEGMDVVSKINGEYGEGAPRGRGPDQGRVQSEGNDYLKKDFSKLDYILSATVLK